MHSRKSTLPLIATSALAGPWAVVLLVAASTVAHAVELTPQEQKLAAAAKQEGAVVLLDPIFSDRTGQRLGEAFVHRYGLGPDFKFSNLRKGTGQTVAQVRQEIVANKFTVDILLVSAPGFFDEAIKHGAFEASDSGYWKEHTELDEAGRAICQLSLRRRAVRLLVPAGLE